MTRRETEGASDGGAEVLSSLAQHRLLSAAQVHAIHTPHASPRWARRLLGRLERAGLATHVRPAGAGKLWQLTQAGADLLATGPDASHEPPKVLTPAQATGPLWRHTLAVNDTGIAFLNAARERGEEFGPLSWRHEVAHRLNQPGRRRQLIVADALLTYLLTDDDEHALEYRFLELDRGTLTVDRLTTKLAHYARLYHDRDPQGQPTWARRYLAFPAVLVVFAHQPRLQLERRMRTVAALCRTDPELERTPQVSVLFALLEDLAREGPFAPIYHTPTGGRVNWLAEPDPARSTA